MGSQNELRVITLPILLSDEILNKNKTQISSVEKSKGEEEVFEKVECITTGRNGMELAAGKN